ncbi:hypothetical protein, partial [uncultured Lamprocystis sp.]|uniref:hypothetical protein n=1 Tax=uncultured Lamprocystis sp. TaxID=543132 RepID=UPI0025EE9D39
DHDYDNDNDNDNDARSVRTSGSCNRRVRCADQAPPPGPRSKPKKSTVFTVPFLSFDQRVG